MDKYTITFWQFTVLVAASFAGMAGIAWIWSEIVLSLGITSIEKQPIEAILASLIHFALTIPVGVVIFFYCLPRLCQKR